MNLPTLYKKTATGALQQWTIGTTQNEIITEWGQTGGALQVGRETIEHGKNIGRSNETTPAQQAATEAQSRWEKKVKKGYVEKIASAQKGLVDSSVITGGIFPMLAKSYDKVGQHIVFPAFVQPKLDGHRCIAVIDRGQVTLWSRTRKPIFSVPHIVAALEVIFKGKSIILDGELYVHALKADFEIITHLIRQETPTQGYEKIEYHIYDVADETKQFWERTKLLQSFQSKATSMSCLHFVDTKSVNDEDELMDAFDSYRNSGYEGCMVRNTLGTYEINKRSVNLQKIKEFEDAEFTLVDIEEGRGKLEGHAIFVLSLDPTKGRNDDNEFRAKMVGDSDVLKQYFESPTKWIGKKVTVKFQGLTNSRKPRFPVALRFREDI